MHECISAGRFREMRLKALLIYDDFEFVANATTLLDLMSPPSDRAEAKDVGWNVKSYRLAALNQKPSADSALMEALDADLVVLAIRNTETLPAWMTDWLESWATRRKFEDPP